MEPDHGSVLRFSVELPSDTLRTLFSVCKRLFGLGKGHQTSLVAGAGQQFRVRSSALYFYRDLQDKRRTKNIARHT